MILSIPHTGTNFLKAYFRMLGREEPNMHIRRTMPRPVILEQRRKGEKFVIPLRDPAENMLSHHHRGLREERDFIDLADDWRFMLTNFSGRWYGRSPDAYFVPLDNGAPVHERVKYLIRAACFAGRELEGKKSQIEAWADTWERHATEGASKEKEIYRSGDMEAFTERCPQIMKALQTITDLMPFFAEQGYKDFNWLSVN